MGFLCKFVRVIRVFKRSFRVPSSRFIIAFFVMLGGRSMSERRKFVLLGGFPVCLVCVVHDVPRAEILAVRRDFVGCRNVGFGFARRGNILSAGMLQQILGASDFLGRVAVDGEQNSAGFDVSCISLG